MSRLLVIVLLLNFWSCSKQTMQPNFVLIMADDLGYGELSCYGSKTVQTPYIDQLAQEGMKLTDFHSNGPVCSPTRAALMTGKYQQRVGIEGVITAANHRDVGLDLEEITIAEELKRLGYTCGIFGKWHLGYAERFNPVHQGFDEFSGFVSGNVDYHSHIDQEGYLDWWRGNKIDNEEGYTTDLITKYGIEFLTNNNSEKTGKPFFLYLPHEAPHYPIQGRIDKPVREAGSGKYIREVSSDSVKIIYREMIETLDQSVGAILKALRDEGLEQNTIVIFCSDNGAAGRRGDNGVLRASKGSLYEGGHRVPAVIRFPGKITAGAVNGTTVMSMDLYPTLIDFAGGRSGKANQDGLSLKRLLLDSEPLPERDLFWSFKKQKAVRRAQWKLVSNANRDTVAYELFDLDADISEQKNLSSSQKHVLEDMIRLLERWDKTIREGAQMVSK